MRKEIKEGSEQRWSEGMRCVRKWGLRQTRRHGGDAQGIAGQLATRAEAPSLSQLAMSAGPDSNPYEGLLVITEC